MEETNTNVHEGSHQTNILMGVLAYLGPLVIVSYLVAKDDHFVKFHIKQGLVVFCIEVLVWILSSMFYWHVSGMYMLIQLLNLATLILSIIGIVNVVQKKEKELPLVGGFASYFTF